MTFLEGSELGTSETARALIDAHVASRLAAQDASVFDYADDVRECAARRMRWTTLATDPPYDPSEIAVVAQQARGERLDAVVLIAQGGSAQAAQTITKLHSLEVTVEVPFRTMDSLSPVYVNHILGSSDPARTIYVVASKSGTTLEPTVLSHVAWKYVCAHLGAEAAGSRFIAITDPGTELEDVARKNGWRAIFHGDPGVGGRFSALSVFGLLPMALVGIDVESELTEAADAERQCAADDEGNPAIWLAAFLYDNWRAGRDKFSLCMPPRNQVFGLWVEQIVAESLGKNGVGILPNVEVDPGILSDPHTDRCAILCNMNNDDAFEHARTCIHPDIPVFRLDIPDSSAMMRYFLIWEYAIAMCGWLMRLNPFDQPDVESTKIATRQILFSDSDEMGLEVPGDPLGRPAWMEFDLEYSHYADHMFVSSAVLELLGDEEVTNVSALRALFCSIEEGDYFALDAFLPFKGIGRRETLERVRHRVADRLGACSCLEIGPRYLHSTGQLQKGGPDTGVFLILSAAESYDISVPHQTFTLGDVASAEAMGDFSALAERGKRAVYLHLRDNDSRYLSLMADDACSEISAAYALREK